MTRDIISPWRDKNCRKRFFINIINFIKLHPTFKFNIGKFLHILLILFWIFVPITKYWCFGIEHTGWLINKLFKTTISLILISNVTQLGALNIFFILTYQFEDNFCSMIVHRKQ